MRILTGPKLQFRQLLFSPDGGHLAGGGPAITGGDIAVVWAAHGNGEPLHSLQSDDPRRYVGMVAFTSDGQRLLTCRDHRHWFALDLAGGQEVPDERLSALEDVTLSDDGRWAARVGNDQHDYGVIHLTMAEYDRGLWTEVWRRPIRYADPDVRIHPDSDEGFHRILFWSGGSRLVLWFQQRAESGHLRGGPCVLRVISTVAGSDESEWRGDLPPSQYLRAISPSGQGLFFVDYSLHIIDITRSASPPLTRANRSQLPFTSAAFSPDGRWLATTCSDTTVTFWDTDTWQPVRRHGWKIGRLRAVAFAPDGLTCAAGSDMGKVVLFDVDV